MFMLVAATAMAQITTADIVGTVVDNSGGVMPHANVTITHASTGVKRTMETNSAGDYVFTQLPIGTYQVVVEAPGFKKFVTKEVTLAAGDRTRVDAAMQLGQVNESVEVSTQAIALQTDSSTVGASVSSTGVQDLPTNGRNFISLVQ